VPYAAGIYDYDKRRRNGSVKRATVAVFPLAVTGQADEWPEQDERDSKWFTLSAAAAAVDEPDSAGSSVVSVIAPPGWQDAAFETMGRNTGREIPMLRWFQALMPKQGRFFELFEDHAATLVAGADALARLFQGGPDIAVHVRRSTIASMRPTISRATCCRMSAAS
jgi:hypothetical protein